MVEDVEEKLPILHYFAISMCSVEVSSLSEADRAKLPRYPVTAVLVTRLAEATVAQGRGLGGALIFKAAEKALLANELVAARLLIVRCPRLRGCRILPSVWVQSFPLRTITLYIGLGRLRAELP